ncbi:hypothetical protein F4703DRAFT_1846868 [Phycomyces blakesleeanus]|uniref:DUF7721 domain-containing protein n=1 Tax=Phycomyces blakesleeanus (strain ATCC 8743b / DSM 1359 / FGSC 10004 / NBRC 33097 / NRRL 1555) TaxID=763407 RepID=A0A162Q860_PHYB8|nr:hypothetical protein PHYBLDRAFT_184474 [Phycomyces blakesleeanus NRRL 1555(-)]OAD80906.1 hypothetical protein PHYBLDRAFT_184474 [Phycomyces blakesleeanus NRRL 1555(-)]|eukprot:XP_018298946.1 hypothetical protein PHYBLDRAFT_184474 [Phycomyces blakesleeanus NRRL 1555(-)]
MSGEANSYLSHYSRPDPQAAARYATQQEGVSEEDEGMFSSVLSRFTGDDDDDDEAPHKRPIQDDEANEAASAHDRIYSQNNGQPDEGNTSRDLGSAAALQAFKMFSGGGGGSGGGSNEMIGMAMGEAMKLFNAQGGKADQSEMLQSAAMMALKLYTTSQASKAGGESSGGLGSIMGMLGGGGGSSGGMAASLLSKFM